MQVNKKTSYGIQSLSLDAILLDDRMVSLYGTITLESVELVVKQLLFLESINSRDPIKLIINSNGGDVSAGLMLYDQITGMKNVPIEMYCIELAASMATIILASGKNGRYILKHSKVMIHEPAISESSGGLCGSASSISKFAEYIMQTKKRLTEILADNTCRSVQKVEKAMSYGKIMSADEAVSFGICDKFIERI